MYKDNQIIKTLILLCLIFGISSCSSINRFTRVKKTPRENSANYCGKEIKAKKSEINKEPWIVFSDRENNPTFTRPGGRIKAKEIHFLEPFLVIKTKNDFLHLIKYTPEIIKNGKLNYKEAEDYGWIHKSNLLLTHQATTDISNGKKIKILAAFSGTNAIQNPNSFFASDCIKLYDDPLMKNSVDTIAPHCILYRFKQSADKKQSLVGKVAYIDAENVSDKILGWIDNSLIQSIGTNLHIDLKSLSPDDSISFCLDKKNEIYFSKEMMASNHLLINKYNTLKYSPVMAYCTQDSSVNLRIRTAFPLFDYSDNYVFNVNGEPIFFNQFQEITQKSKRINVSFVFEGKDQTIQSFPKIINALQNLQPLFKSEKLNEDGFTIQFNSVLTFNNSGKFRKITHSNFSSEYSETLQFLSDKINEEGTLQSVPSSIAWSGLNKALDLIESQEEANNLIVLIGDIGTKKEEQNSDLINRLVKNNCRILGFQTHNGSGDFYNNFVLEMAHIINSYAQKSLTEKKNILVSPNQVKDNNYFIQSDDMQNSYKLDFPNNSITQGFLFFPQKGKSLPLSLLSENTDSILQQIKDDNTHVLEQINQAFLSSGRDRTKLDSLFVRNFNLETTQMIQKELPESFFKEIPAWSILSNTLTIDDSVNKSTKYHLLLSQKEMDELISFIADLSSIEIDYQYPSEKKKKEKKLENSCECPENDALTKIEKEDENIISHPIPIKYVNTKKIRKHIYKVYRNSLSHCFFCKQKKENLDELNLAEIHYQITRFPSSNELLNSILLKEIRNKKEVSNLELEKLLAYLIEKKKALETAESFESNGETYYWIGQKQLP